MKKIICMILSSVLLTGGIVGCSEGGNTGDMKKFQRQQNMLRQKERKVFHVIHSALK